MKLTVKVLLILFAHYEVNDAPLSFSDDFSGGVGGWTAGTSTTVTENAGRLQTQNVGTANGFAFKEIAVTPGVLYAASVLNASAAGNIDLRVGTSANASDICSHAGVAPANTASCQFTPAGASVFVSLRNPFNGNGSTRLFDNVTVEPV